MNITPKDFEMNLATAVGAVTLGVSAMLTTIRKTPAVALAGITSILDGRFSGAPQAVRDVLARGHEILLSALTSVANMNQAPVLAPLRADKGFTGPVPGFNP